MFHLGNFNKQGLFEENLDVPFGLGVIHKKVVPASAELRRQFEFSAEGLSEKAKSIKIALFAELLTVVSLIYLKSFQ